MIPERDLKITRLRNGGGNGGQNKNKVETAVRIEHLPSGIVVTANSERSQQANLAEAIRRIEERLANKAELIRAREAKKRWESNPSGGFGSENRVRSYYFVKDQVAIDHRSGMKLPIWQVMDGKIDGMIVENLKITNNV